MSLISLAQDFEKSLNKAKIKEILLGMEENFHDLEVLLAGVDLSLIENDEEHDDLVNVIRLLNKYKSLLKNL